MTVIRLVSGRLQVVCAALMMLGAMRIAQAATTGGAPTAAGPVTSVRGALR